MWRMSYIGDTLRIGWGAWIDYWNQLMGNILSYTMSDKDPPDNIRSGTAKYHARNLLLLLGLMAASTKYSSVPNINLSGDRMLDKDDKIQRQGWKAKDLQFERLLTESSNICLGYYSLRPSQQG